MPQTENPLSELEKKLDYHFLDQERLSLALTHKSVGSPNNERMEFLGDALLNMVVAEALFHQHTDVDEGMLSAARSQLVRGKTLAKIGFDIGIDEHIRLGQGERSSARQVKQSIVGDAVEAILGAVYLDAGFDQCRELIMRLYQERLSLVSMERSAKDPKSQLQELMQSMGFALPAYAVTDVHGPDHEQLFVVECQLPALSMCGNGEGSNRRAAEQAAAAHVLDLLKKQSSP